MDLSPRLRWLHRKPPRHLHGVNTACFWGMAWILHVFWVVNTACFGASSWSAMLAFLGQNWKDTSSLVAHNHEKLLLRRKGRYAISSYPRLRHKNITSIIKLKTSCRDKPPFRMAAAYLSIFFLPHLSSFWKEIPLIQKTKKETPSSPRVRALYIKWKLSYQIKQKYEEIYHFTKRYKKL